MKKKIFLITTIVCILIIGIFSVYWQKSSQMKMKENRKNNISNINRVTTSNSTTNSVDNSLSNSNLESNEVTNTNTVIDSNTSSNTTSNSNTSSNKTSNSNKPSNSSSNVTKPLTVAEKIDKNLKEMTLDEKIGQLLIVSVNGKEMTSTTKDMLKKYKPGGVILFAPNLGNYNTTIKFIDEIKKTNDIPLIISIDQEGGKVQRLTSITGKKATNIPAMASLGKIDDENLAYSVGTVIGEELRVFGFNMDFAPVLDVNGVSNAFMGTRSFGTDANKVSKLGISLANGIESKGVIPVYKHFPGHGGTVTDSHYDLPVINKTKAELYDNDLLPFQNAIQNGAKVIMVGHLAIPQITNDNVPASLSKTLITDLLKKEMGYNGLVITDALNMGALTSNYSEKQIYEMAINAGVDILLMPKSAESAIKYIKQSIKEGKVKESQIDESVRKILMLKYTTMKTDNLSINYLGSKAHQDIINKVNE